MIILDSLWTVLTFQARQNIVDSIAWAQNNIPVLASIQSCMARVAELVDAADLKSAGHCGRAGSIPASGTKRWRLEFGPAMGSISGLLRPSRRLEFPLVTLLPISRLEYV